MLGGFNVFGKGAYAKKNFSDLPKHNKAVISFRFFKIDSWDGEAFIVKVNGN